MLTDDDDPYTEFSPEDAAVLVWMLLGSVALAVFLLWIVFR